MPRDVPIRFPRAPSDAPLPEPVKVRPATRAILPPPDESALWAALRDYDAEPRVPHVRRVVRTAEALIQAEDTAAHPLGRNPDLWTEPSNLAMPSWSWGSLLLLAFLGGLMWAAIIWLGLEAAEAVREAMEHAAAEAVARGAW